MDPLATLDLARAEWERRLSVVAPDQWGRPTPCTDWTVRDLVHHLTLGNRMAVMLLAGRSRDDTLAQIREWHRDESGDSPDALRETFRVSADAQAAALREPGALERTCHHPVGDVPGARLLGFRTGDLTLHAWDLARAIGADEQMDAELVAQVYASMAPMASFIATTGMFGAGPSGDVDDTATAQRRLLDLAGRRP